MLYDVIGVRRGINIKNDDGTSTVGTTIYVTAPEDGVEGVFPDKIFVRIDSSLHPTVDKLHPPVAVDLEFNRRGRLQSISVMD